MTAPIVGIDLGTTHSLVALFEDGQPKLIPNAHGDVLTPSVVGLLEDDQVVVGAAARELRVIKPERCAARFKRFMGTDQKLPLASRTFTAVELSSLVLKSLKHDAEAYLGMPVEEAVITVPAYFNDHQRKATKLAGEMAELRVRRIINEPTAAALTYGFHERQADKHLLVIDLGGGTFDVTLMEVFEGTLEIVATSGENFLGGEDFTDRLVAAVLNHAGLQLESAELKQPLRVARLREECERAKRCLRNEDKVAIRLPDERGEFGDGPAQLTVTNSTFAKLVAPILQRVSGPIHKALRDGGREPSEVDEAILVGGATRMKCLREYVERLMLKPPLMTFNPDEVVALGAAVQAALLSEDRAVDDMVMTDVCPHTLGVEVCKEFGRHHETGYFSPVIHRNTTIPVSREEIYATLTPNQYEVLLKVYQGESRRVKDNLLLGELRVDGIPPGPAGQEVVVRFTYDVNGILEVEAFLPTGAKRFRTVLTQNAASLTAAEIDAAVQKMQGIKFYPRDDVENRRLVLFCERAVGEVSTFHREELEVALDNFQQAMASGDREYFANARQGLLMVLSQLGLDYTAAEDEA